MATRWELAGWLACCGKRGVDTGVVRPPRASAPRTPRWGPPANVVAREDARGSNVWETRCAKGVRTFAS